MIRDRVSYSAQAAGPLGGIVRNWHKSAVARSLQTGAVS